MFLSAMQCAFRRTLAIVLAGALTATSWAQTPAQPAAAAPDGPRPQASGVMNYSKPTSHFPNPIGPYKSHSVAPPDLSNTPRIETLMQNGKLMLSMNDAVALAMENNLDIAIQRYNLNIADTDVLRSLAGASTLGVNSGIVAGTPGGGPVVLADRSVRAPAARARAPEEPAPALADWLTPHWAAAPLLPASIRLLAAPCRWIAHTPSRPIFSAPSRLPTRIPASKLQLSTGFQDRYESLGGIYQHPYHH